MLTFSKREKIFVWITLAMFVVVAVLGLIFVERDRDVKSMATSLQEDIAQFQKDLDEIKADLEKIEGDTPEAVVLRQEYENKLMKLAVALKQYEEQAEIMKRER